MTPVNFDVSIIAVTCYSNKPVMQLDSFPFPIKTKYLFYYNFTEKSIFFSWKRKLSDLWFWEKIGQLTWKEILWRDINCNFKRVNSLYLYRKVFLATLKSSYFFFTFKIFVYDCHWLTKVLLLEWQHLVMMVPDLVHHWWPPCHLPQQQHGQQACQEIWQIVVGCNFAVAGRRRDKSHWQYKHFFNLQQLGSCCQPHGCL